jgi:hypothetical protein
MNTNTISKIRPWPGLTPYSINDSGYFLGRSTEITELIERITAEPLNCLYGPSGVGKSSLLQAGIGHKIKEHGFFPIFIRLNHQDSSISYIEQTFDSVRTTAKNDDIEIEEVEKAFLSNGEETLWEFFHRHVFWDKRNHPVKPLLVFDQFEELFTLSNVGENAKMLVEALGELAENVVPVKIQAYLRETNTRLLIPSNTLDYRILITLREDFLAQLEMLTIQIPSFRRNRYGLKVLNGCQALEIIKIPGNDVIEENVAEEIIQTISAKNNRSETRISLSDCVVEPALLSLFCRELNEQRITHGKELITVEQVRNHGKDIIRNFYLSCVKSVSGKTTEFIEERLLTESGFRNPVALEDILADKIDRNEIDKLINLRLLRIEERQGVLWVEFSHDILTNVALANRNDRRSALELEKQKRFSERLISEQLAQKRRYRNWGIITILMLLLLLSVILHKADQKRKAMIIESKLTYMETYIENQLLRNKEEIESKVDAYSKNMRTALLLESSQKCELHSIFDKPRSLEYRDYAYTMDKNGKRLNIGLNYGYPLSVASNGDIHDPNAARILCNLSNIGTPYLWNNMFAADKNEGTKIMYAYTGTKDGYFSQYPWQESFPKTPYDPRERPWYKNALSNPGEKVWSIYVFATPKILGYTCSKAIYDDASGVMAVCAADVELSSVLGTFKNLIQDGDILIHFVYPVSSNNSKLHVMWSSDIVDKRFDDWQNDNNTSEMIDSITKGKICYDKLLNIIKTKKDKKGFFYSKYMSKNAAYAYCCYDWDYIGSFTEGQNKKSGENPVANQQNDKYQAVCLLIMTKLK